MAYGMLNYSFHTILMNKICMYKLFTHLLIVVLHWTDVLYCVAFYSVVTENTQQWVQW